MPVDQPNVLWICTDQQRLDSIECYGNSIVETPNIDRLAGEGVRFERAYAQNPICSPSRGSFLTGRYPRTNGLRQNGQSLPEDETLVTRTLADEGYTCGLSGKLHLAPCNRGKPNDPSFERRIDDGYGVFHWSHSPDHESPANQYRDWLRERGVEYEKRVIEESGHVLETVNAEHHQTTWCAEKAINFIEAHEGADRPWLFSVNPFDPHHPFDAPPSYLNKYLDRWDEIPLPEYEPGELDDKPVFQQNCHEGAYTDRDFYPFPEMDDDDHRAIRAAYYAMVDLIDDQVGRLLDALERTGQREDTIVVFMSDHGEMLGEHGIYLKGPFLYDDLVNVPLIVSQPGTIPEGVVSEALVELVDLTPTLLEATETPARPGVQGESFWPLLSGESDSDRHREYVYAECLNSMAWQNDPKPYVTMIRGGRYKLIEAHGEETGELYDLRTDPGERDNKWDRSDYRGERERLRSVLTDRVVLTADPLPEREAPW